MGMDYVEMMMDVEKEFDIRLDDDSYSRVFTVGDLCDEVILLLSANDKMISEHQRQQIFTRICCIVGETMGINSANIKRSDRFIEDLGAT